MAVATARRTRADLLAEATELRRQGLTVRQIGERMGRTRSTIQNLFSDPDGAKQKARRASYCGVCADCGAPTDGSNGPGKAPPKCFYCFNGRERPHSQKPRLCVPFRLTEISEDARLDGAVAAARTERDPDARLEILLAAIQPSDTTYWLAESARPLLEQLAA